MPTLLELLKARTRQSQLVQSRYRKLKGELCASAKAAKSLEERKQPKPSKHRIQTRPYYRIILVIGDFFEH